eukprot:GAHX01006972.1.p1 GENE.GAHX01006972.1~~GAHX01006972.1.p1  ORF type:complete len:51 (-),score=1.03 GAHX01006972.1:73-225(-)
MYRRAGNESGNEITILAKFHTEKTLQLNVVLSFHPHTLVSLMIHSWSKFM